ncbi:hypothetical protein BH18ACT5_BH18ACT5_16530 [soil metagenome]
MRRSYQLLVLLAIGAACTTASEATADISGGWQLISGSLSGQPIPLVETSPITLRVEESNVSGSSACNQYGGLVSVDGSTIAFGDLASALMGCEPDVMAAEAAYTNALRQVDTISFDGEDLVLSGVDADLRFKPTG